jgi:hypothetical protein
MYYRIFTGACLLLITIVSGAQSNYGIRRTDAFFTEHLPGNIPVDEQGHSLYHGPDTINTVYVETKGTPAKWIAAWKNGSSFSVIVTAITEIPYEVGVDKYNNQKVVLQPAKGNKLWLLQFEKKEIPLKPPVKMKAGEIILQGRSGKRTFIQRISSQIELAAIPSV